MKDDQARTWLRDKVLGVSTARAQPTTTYNVGGVPLSVTGAHVAFMVVPTSQSDDDGAPGREEEHGAS